MNNTTKALLVCLAIVGGWIAFQQAYVPAKKPAVQPQVVSSGG